MHTFRYTKTSCWERLIPLIYWASNSNFFPLWPFSPFFLRIQRYWARIISFYFPDRFFIMENVPPLCSVIRSVFHRSSKLLSAESCWSFAPRIACQNLSREARNECGNADKTLGGLGFPCDLVEKNVQWGSNSHHCLLPQLLPTTASQYRNKLAFSSTIRDYAIPQTWPSTPPFGFLIWHRQQHHAPWNLQNWLMRA